MKVRIETDGAPGPVGPYSQAVRSGGLLFLSGQVALDPQSGSMVGNGVAEQTRRALENLGAVLTAGGSNFESVLRTTVFLTDMSHFAAMNEVYAAYFTGVPPARSTVAVSALPKGALVEIDAIALVG